MNRRDFITLLGRAACGLFANRTKFSVFA